VRRGPTLTICLPRVPGGRVDTASDVRGGAHRRAAPASVVMANALLYWVNTAAAALSIRTLAFFDYNMFVNISQEVFFRYNLTVVLTAAAPPLTPHSPCRGSDTCSSHSLTSRFHSMIRH
jgi:hypothetical protein